jgi:hypothetical protein
MSINTNTQQTTQGEVEIRMDSTGQMMLVAGVIAVIVSLLFGIPGPLGIGILFVIIGIWRIKTPIIRFGQDHFETKLAPAAGHHKLLYSEVVRIESTSKQRMTIYYRAHNSAKDAAPTRIKLNLKSLKEPERERCINEFRARLPESLFVAL